MPPIHVMSMPIWVELVPSVLLVFIGLGMVFLKAIRAASQTIEEGSASYWNIITTSLLRPLRSPRWPGPMAQTPDQIGLI
jgi:hypothetical protein